LLGNGVKTQKESGADTFVLARYTYISACVVINELWKGGRRRRFG
jgi:hypothetical protein